MDAMEVNAKNRNRKASRRKAYGLAILILVVIALSMASMPPPSQTRLEAITRENDYLAARQEALRRAAFDLADELYLQVEHDRRAMLLAGHGDPVWFAVHDPPPSRAAGNDAILAWLSKQTSHIQTLPPDAAAWP